MQLSNVRRIVVEDFPKEHRQTVEKLATIINSFMEEVVALSQKNVDFENLNRSKITIEVTVDASGTPSGVTQINTQLSSFSGSKIIDVQNLVGGANVVSAPYLDCTYQGNGVVRINKIYGTNPGKRSRITIEFIA